MGESGRSGAWVSPGRAAPSQVDPSPRQDPVGPPVGLRPPCGPPDPFDPIPPNVHLVA